MALLKIAFSDVSGDASILALMVVIATVVANLARARSPIIGRSSPNKFYTHTAPIWFASTSVIGSLIGVKNSVPGETELGNAGTLAQQGISRIRGTMSMGVPMTHWLLVGSL